MHEARRVEFIVRISAGEVDRPEARPRLHVVVITSPVNVHIIRLNVPTQLIVVVDIGVAERGENLVNGRVTLWVVLYEHRQTQLFLGQRVLRGRADVVVSTWRVGRVATSHRDGYHSKLTPYPIWIGFPDLL